MAALGLGGLHLLLRDFGYARILSDIEGLGFSFLPIALCFLIPFTFQSLGWKVLVQGWRAATFPYLYLVTVVAFAWNNLGPVSKSLGEPTRVMLLRDRLPLREALRSMMLINLAQSMGSLLVFSLGAALAPLFFTLSDTAFWVTVVSALGAMAVNVLILIWVLRGASRVPSRGRRLRSIRHWLRWVAHQLRKYTRAHPWRYALSLCLCACSRVSEGIVFYVIFRALHSPLSFWESIALDTGRGIADNAFFFVPYQLGAREYSLVFLTESVLHTGTDTAVAASIIFRLGEISWIVLGFLLGLWLMRRRKESSAKD
jgi:hypothetical protein